MKMKRIIAALFVLFLLPITTFAVDEIKGDYDLVLPGFPPEPHSLDKVVMHEVFSFTCIHCFELNKEIHELKEYFGDKLEIQPQPIGWRGMEPGKLYFLAEKYGKGEAVKTTIFEFYFEKGFKDKVFTKDILRFVAKMHGLSKEFKKEIDSPEIVKKMKDSMQFGKDKQVNATPTLVIEEVIKANRDLDNLKVIINSLLKKPVKK